MNCLIKNCTAEQGMTAGRTICVEPDDDGWICETCWRFLTTGEGTNSAAYKLAHSAEYLETLSPENDEFLRDLRYMEERIEVEEDNEFDALMDHFAENGASRLSYGNLVRSKGMDGVREGRLTFDNFTLDEKVILKRNGVMIYHGDTYDRDACRCENFACEERWQQLYFRGDVGWQSHETYQNYLRIIEEHEARMGLEALGFTIS